MTTWLENLVFKLEPTKPSDLGRPYSFGNGKLGLQSLLVSEFSCCLPKTEGTKKYAPVLESPDLIDLKTMQSLISILSSSIGHFENKNVA